MELRILRNKKKSIVIGINKKEYELQANWLYEHSKDKLIRDAYTNQLLIEAAEIPKNLKINQAILNKNCLQICFSNKTTHKYAISYLYNQINGQKNVTEKFLWDNKNSIIPKYDFLKINDKVLYKIMSAVEKYGFCLVKNIPNKRNGLNELMKLIGPVKKTNWGGIADVTSIKKAYDLTMTTRGLENHTDNPYRFPTQGYIFLHCIENAEKGGSNTIADGFKIAEILKKRYRNHYNTLTTFNTFFKYKDDKAHLEYSCKLIELDDNKKIQQIRYNNRTEVIPYASPLEISRYVEARSKFWELIKNPLNNIKIKQKSGDMLILDNYRVLHGRSEYTEINKRRYFRQGYMDRDIFLSKLKTLN
mgnify:CR=1 FL=1